MIAKIEQDGAAVVVTSDQGSLVSRRFIIGQGGFVLEHKNGWQQVCQGLLGSGNTLTCHGGSLIDVIRREFYNSPYSDVYELEI